MLVARSCRTVLRSGVEGWYLGPETSYNLNSDSASQRPSPRRENCEVAGMFLGHHFVRRGDGAFSVCVSTDCAGSKK